MPELVLIELAKSDVADAMRQIRNGADAYAVCGPLWADHPDLACLICDAPTGERPFTIISRNRPPDRSKVVAAPLCQTCAALPELLRMHRAESMLRRMWSRPGRQVHFR
jgi:hypothetical protein